MKTGTYFYRVYHPATNYYSSHSVKVEIIQKTVVSYEIKYIGFPSNGSRPGMTSWVRKHHVKYIVDDSPRPVIPCTCIYDDTIRLPYKDN